MPNFSFNSVLPDYLTVKLCLFQYRSLVESETLEFTLRVKYPIKWNDHQEWVLNLTGCKASVWFIYEHKEFFQGEFLGYTYIYQLSKVSCVS